MAFVTLAQLVEVAKLLEAEAPLCPKNQPNSAAPAELLPTAPASSFEDDPHGAPTRRDGSGQADAAALAQVDVDREALALESAPGRPLSLRGGK